MRATQAAAVLLVAMVVSGAVHAQQIPSFCGPTTPTCPPPTFTWPDIPIDAATYRSTDYVVVSGWAFQCGRPLLQWAIELDGLFIGPYASGPVPTPSPAVVLRYRPDVSAYFNAVFPHCMVSDWAGFSFVFTPGSLSIGEHTIRVWVLTTQWNDLAPTWQPTQKVTVHLQP